MTLTASFLFSVSISWEGVDSPIGLNKTPPRACWEGRRSPTRFASPLPLHSSDTTPASIAPLCQWLLDVDFDVWEVAMPTAVRPTALWASYGR